MLEIITKLGRATPPPIPLNRLIQSPLQDLFCFSTTTEDRVGAVRIFELLGEASVNLRFISEQPGQGGEARIQFCSDAEARDKVLSALQTKDLCIRMKESCHHPDVIILSFYPFKGQPQIAGRIFTVLRLRGIEPLGANTATSVFSCIVSQRDLKETISSLSEAFLWQ